MTQRVFRGEGSGEDGSGLLAGQEEGEGLGGGPPSGDDSRGAGDDPPLSLDDFPEPDGDQVDPWELSTAQEEADELAHVREALAELADPEGMPEEVDNDPGDEDRHDADEEGDEELAGEGDDYEDASYDVDDEDADADGGDAGDA